MPQDPRGHPTDEDYIHHLEFLNEQKQKLIMKLYRENFELRKKKLSYKVVELIRKLAALYLYALVWIPGKIIDKWAELLDERAERIEEAEKK